MRLKQGEVSKVKQFMIDIETTGIDPKTEDLLQIGVLELDFVHGFWRPGRNLEINIHTDREPASEFAKQHMAALYKKCNESGWIAPPDYIRQTLLRFFTLCGAESPNVYVMGWNASNFDIPFLCHKGVLVPTKYVTGPDGKDTMVGDFHYRIYELGGAISLAADVLGVPDKERSELCKQAEAAGDMIQLPEGKEHDALFDCYKQAKILNGLIALIGKYGVMYQSGLVAK